MSERSLELLVGPAPDRPRAADGTIMQVPEGWALLPPGDATLTRRVKQAGPSWSVKERRGRKMFSRGVWAPAPTIERIKRALDEERDDPRYARQLEAQRARRAKKQAAYVLEFEREVLKFLRFHPRYASLARRVAHTITNHAVPVGSGTVARTERISIERRAEAAVIAWLRHQTTAYDSMKIPRVKGMRREVRRRLATRSRELLARYRRGDTIDASECIMERAIPS